MPSVMSAKIDCLYLYICFFKFLVFALKIALYTGRGGVSLTGQYNEHLHNYRKVYQSELITFPQGKIPGNAEPRII